MANFTQVTKIPDTSTGDWTTFESGSQTFTVGEAEYEITTLSCRFIIADDPSLEEATNHFCGEMPESEQAHSFPYDVFDGGDELKQIENIFVNNATGDVYFEMDFNRTYKTNLPNTELQKLIDGWPDTCTP